MSKLRGSLFSRIYGALFVAIFSSLALTVVILESWDDEYAIDHFYNDTVLVKKLLEQHRIKAKASTRNYYASLETQLYPFDIRWLEQDARVCEQCVLIEKRSHITIYQRYDGRLVSVHFIPSEEGRLLIQDHFDDQLLMENQSLDLEVFAIPLLCLFFIVAAGVVIYLPLRRLESTIKQLDETTEQIGRGDFSVRVKTTASPPLTRLGNRLNQMAEALNHKFAETQVFAQAVPHELRTPLSRIQLATGLLRKDSTNADHIELLKNIDDYIEDIDELCSQIIQLSKLNMSTESLATDNIPLADFIQQRVNQLALRAQIDVGIECDINIALSVSSVNLRLVLDNLLRNAEKYANARVSITVIERDNQVILNVADDGCGIPDSEKENIFIPFARLDKSRNRNTGGFGLGLAICRAAVKAMGGSIDVLDGTEVGSIFRVIIER